MPHRFQGLRLFVAVCAPLLMATPARARTIGDDAPPNIEASSQFKDQEMRADGDKEIQAVADGKALSHSLSGLSSADRFRFHLGRALFRKKWVSAPSSTQASDGLGPYYNARSCDSCHAGNGGGAAASLLLRLGRQAATDAERRDFARRAMLSFGDPVYGRQLQDKAVPGIRPEGRVALDRVRDTFTYPDGETVALSKPAYRIESLKYGPLDPATTISPRMAPRLAGLGLIEAIADADILANADEGDKDGDGISGKAQIRSDEAGRLHVGRFGWKAENHSLLVQSAQAFSSDIGISTPPLDAAEGDCTARQKDCLMMPSGVQIRLGKTEAPDPVLALVSFYIRHVAVPARRNVASSDVLKGEELFLQTGCAACHRKTFRTRPDHPDGSLAGQTIWPYSDFLLHDMGSELADGQETGVASGGEWRTPPLWGIGLAQAVEPRAAFLHDGRAQTLEEAILWHGGEAAKARQAFASLSHMERRHLIEFLESL